MAEIIAGVAMSQSTMIMTSEEAGGEKGKRFIQTTAEMKKWLKDSGAYILVLVSNDILIAISTIICLHLRLVLMNVKDGEIGRFKIPVQKDLAKHILTSIKSGPVNEEGNRGFYGW